MLPTDPPISLTTAGSDLVVRNIDASDLELLRTWKNRHRESFFFKDIITPEMQERWFQGYLGRPDDFMLMMVAGQERIGCIGFRRLDDRIDFYNLILGEDAQAGQGYMTQALDLACQEAERRYPGAPVMVSVLRTNPALRWYFRRGFQQTAEHEDYLELARDAAHWRTTEP